MTAMPLSDRYRQMDISAMTPAGRIVALYARILLSLKQAQVAITRREIEVREQRLLQATEILHELTVSLDHEQGGEIAHRLAELYAWMIRECFEIHRRPDSARLDTVITCVAELHEAWVEISRQMAPPPLQLERAG